MQRADAARERQLVEIGPAPGGGEARGTPRRRPDMGFMLPVVSALLFVGLIYALWTIVSASGAIPAIILPPPGQVAQSFGLELASGDLMANVWTTVQEALGGFGLAVIVAAVCGYAIAHVRPLEVLAAPFVAASQAIPIVAVAPLIILLLGSGLWPHVVVSAMVVVFPLLITTVAGLRGVERDYHDVARVFGASRLQTIWFVELPLAARTLLSGVKLGLTLAVMGAVVSEYVNASSGLGFMINGAIGNFESATRYVALIALAALSIILFSVVTLLERIILRW